MYIVVLILYLSCPALSEKSDSLTGTITFIRHNFPQPDSVQKLDLGTTDTLELLRSTDERPYIRNFRYSPDGHHFVIVMGSIENELANTELYIGDDSGGQIKQLTENSTFDGYPTWSADGKRIVFLRGVRDGRFWVVDLETKQERQVPNPDFRLYRWADWLPDGQRLIVVAKTNNGTSRSRQISGLAEVHLVKGTTRWLYKGDFSILTPILSPDRTQIACVVQSPRPYFDWEHELEFVYRVNVLDLDTERIKPVDDGPEGFERDLWPVWSPDGKQLAWIRTDKRKRTSMLFISNLIGSELRKITLPEEAADGYSLLWSPDNKYLACLTHQQYTNYTLRVIILKNGRSKGVLTSKSQIELLCWQSS